jgi:hypothetical protein
VQHARNSLAGNEVEQLLMVIVGQGGTGKTTLINAITRAFDQVGISSWLAKTAISGVAASLIGGRTVHWWAGIPVQNEGDVKEPSTRAGRMVEERRKRNIAGKKYLIIDEISMMDSATLAKASAIINRILRPDNSERPFGGLNVILLGRSEVMVSKQFRTLTKELGDFHQFPPPRNATGALYSTQMKGQNNVLGRALFLQFNKVVILREQRRIQDGKWCEILERSRTGSCTKEDVAEIRKLVLTNAKCEVPDFSQKPWSQAVLITPRNAVRIVWNIKAIEKLKDANRTLLYQCHAEDTIGTERRLLGIQERVQVAGTKVTKTARLPEISVAAARLNAEPSTSRLRAGNAIKS